jgi:hypothetical protein
MHDIAPPVNGRFGYPLGFAAGVLVTIVAVAAHGTAHPSVALAALTATAALVAAVTTLSAALASAAVSWGLHAGFVLGRRGELEFSQASTVAAGVLGGAAVVTFAVVLAVRYSGRPVNVRAAIPTWPMPRRTPSGGQPESIG